MPKEIPFKKISETKFTYDSEVKISGYDCKVQVPAKLGYTLKNKKIKITIEVI
ncbi:MAG: hypothetical protein KC550_02765 [Nanoarchaeota archaeon]|nr:hypothetical protein [Nanoarchaeota archaeon]